HPNSPLRRERDRRSARRQWMVLTGCLLLAAGFVFAARQQIVAVQYGYKSEELRRERERLVEEHERLRVELEANSSPARLEQAARELGLQPARAGQIGTGARITDGEAAREDVADDQSPARAGAEARRASRSRITTASFVGAARVPATTSAR
ncbi:MAG TPA: hypothetical protein VFX96_13900, partial [Pyrinomonadaceae bacterium]|nr:hypothetical protein [Pyrinomonadaceae bacterium]